MKRQRVKSQVDYQALDQDQHSDDEFPMERRTPRRTELTMEAEILPNDTLASIALRFNCTVHDLRRLNKIDKDNEIYARKTLKIPITAQNILLDTLPNVHKSGNNSPKTGVGRVENGLLHQEPSLDVKLIVASVSNSEYVNGETRQQETVEDIETPIPHVVLARPRFDLSINGSDCDMNWICLFIFILAFCAVIPLVYVIWKTEEIEKLHHEDLLEHANHAL